MYKFVIDDSNEKYDVYVNTISSAAGVYLSRHPHMYSLIRELLTASKLSGDRIVLERDMGRDIGTTDVVVTSEKDTIYYAQPIKSEVFSRFAKNRFPQTSSLLTAVFEIDDEGNYEVVDTWIGAHHPPFPGDKAETTNSKEYWESHALVQGSQNIRSKTLTKSSPY